jgi:hypothetical protein
MSERQDNGELRIELQLEINYRGPEGEPGQCFSVDTGPPHTEIMQLSGFAVEI